MHQMTGVNDKNIVVMKSIINNDEAKILKNESVD